MSDQPYAPSTDQPAAPAPVDEPAAPAEQAPADTTPAAPAPAEQPAPEPQEEPAAPSLKIGQIVGYTDEEFGYDVARHGIVVEVDGDNARVVPLPGARHFAVDELTAQD